MQRQRKLAAPPSASAWLRPSSHPSGKPLEPATRQWMESRFTHDFSRVRVHTDDAAARALGARAFTRNDDVTFANGEYSPYTNAGRELLAHELAHVAGARERNADTAADDVMHGRAPDLAETHAPAAIAMKEKPLEERARDLARDLRILIDSQEGVRRTARKEASAPMVERAKERREGKLPELTGIGRIESIDRFVAAVRALQSQWPSLKPQARAEAVGNAAGDALEAAGVPRFLDIEVGDLTPNYASFGAADWAFRVDKSLVDGNALDDLAAGKLTNAVFHEARHAEQHFLAARHAAALSEKKGHDIPRRIKRLAAERPLTDAEAPLAAAMYDAHVQNRGAKQRTIEAMTKAGKAVIIKRRKAEKALQKLEKSPSERTYRKARLAHDALLDTIHTDRAPFADYLALPSERDASEVGESAALAFRDEE